jgi:NTP pyrophosphatase (non-canonical NTP hydrolase)
VSLQSRSTAWRAQHYPDCTPTDVVAKLFEEGGELARAIIGDLEGRPDRGDVGQEAAQVVLVVLSLVGRFYPDIDVLAEVNAELLRHGA